MIDLHCHIHPGVDDGPKNVEESIALAKALVAAGVHTVAATSHVRPDKGWMNTLDVAVDLVRTTQSLLDQQGIPLKIVKGAEHYLDAAVFPAELPQEFLAETVVTYGESQWILFEWPYHGPPPNPLALVARIRRKGYRLLFAHLERFGYIADDLSLVEELLCAGHLVQVNLGSLAGVYNKEQQRRAERLLKEGFVSVLAGDCHREADVAENIHAGLKAAEKCIGPSKVALLTEANPQKILANMPAEKIWPSIS